MEMTKYHIRINYFLSIHKIELDFWLMKDFYGYFNCSVGKMYVGWRHWMEGHA